MSNILVHCSLWKLENWPLDAFKTVKKKHDTIGAPQDKSVSQLDAVIEEPLFVEKVLIKKP